MLTGGQVAQMRAALKARMRDTCLITSESVTVDPGTLTDIELSATIYNGPCRLSSRSNAVSERESAGQSFSEQSLILSIPVDQSADVRVNAVVTITAVDPVSGDPALIGRQFRIAGLASGSQATAARFPVVWS